MAAFGFFLRIALCLAFLNATVYPAFAATENSCRSALKADFEELNSAGLVISRLETEAVLAEMYDMIFGPYDLFTELPEIKAKMGRFATQLSQTGPEGDARRREFALRVYNRLWGGIIPKTLPEDEESAMQMVADGMQRLKLNKLAQPTFEDMLKARKMLEELERDPARRESLLSLYEQTNAPVAKLLAKFQFKDPSYSELWLMMATYPFVLLPVIHAGKNAPAVVVTTALLSIPIVTATWLISYAIKKNRPRSLRKQLRRFQEKEKKRVEKRLGAA